MLQFESNQAHFITHESYFKEKSGRGRIETSRWLIFKIGRSEKYFYFKDEHLNDEGRKMLERDCRKRLAVKGHLSPKRVGCAAYMILDSWGVYHRKTGEAYNPQTQGQGFYKMRSDN